MPGDHDRHVTRQCVRKPRRVSEASQVLVRLVQKVFLRALIDGDVLKVMHQELEIDASLLHLEVANHQMDALVDQDCHEVAPKVENRQEESTAEPAGSMENEWQEKDGSVEVRIHKGVELGPEGTHRAEVRANRSTSSLFEVYRS